MPAKRPIHPAREPGALVSQRTYVGFAGAADPQNSGSYVLRAKFPDGRRQMMHIREPRRVIGRAGDIVVEDRGVNDEHAELVFRDGLVGVRDLCSRTGTWVEGRRVPRRVLRPGRGFRIGLTRFELVDVRGDAEQQPEELETQLWDVRAGFADARGGVALRKPIIAPLLDAAVVRDEPRSPVPARRVPPPEEVEVDGEASALLIAEADEAGRAWLQQALAQDCTVASEGAGVLEEVGRNSRTVIVLGRRLADMTPAALVAALRESELFDRVCILAAEEVVADSEDIYYRLQPGLSAFDLRKVVASARRPRADAALVPASGTSAWQNKLVFDVCAAASTQPDAASAAIAIEDGVSRMLNVARVSCVFHDHESGQLWTESTDAPVQGSASSGLVGFVARTASAVHAPVVASDPRYEAAVDDPNGTGSEAILAVPVVTGTEVHAVLVAVREQTQGWFDQSACDRLGRLGIELGPILGRLCAALDAQEVLDRLQRPRALQLFRPEAVEAYLERKDEGEVIRVAPHWSRTMYWSLLAMLVVGMGGIAIGRISHYSSGPAVIRQEGRAEIAAAGAGAIASIDVEPGQRVGKGQVLARLQDVGERADFDSTRSDFRSQLRNRLLDPTDEVAATAVRTLKRQLESAEAALELRVVRSPHDGIVTDVGVDAGQHVGVGDAIMAVVDESVPGIELIAFLPGGDRPQIEPGMPIRFELLGFDYAYQDVNVDSITEGVVGPAEAKRLLGPQLADTLPIGGGVVMVRASLPSTTFESDATVYPYHDGMGATAELRLRDETILELLFPALKEL